MRLRFFCIKAGIYPNEALFRVAKLASADGDKRYERYLCSPLSIVSEIIDDCDRYLQYIEEIENGMETVIEAGANDIALTFRPSGVQVDILINDDWCDQPEGHFELHEWKTVLEGWRRFLGMPEAIESVVEVTL